MVVPMRLATADTVFSLTESAANIKSPLMFQNASTDTRILAGRPLYEAALTDAGVTFESYVYAGASHGFHNNTTPRYDEAAAALVG